MTTARQSCIVARYLEMLRLRQLSTFSILFKQCSNPSRMHDSQVRKNLGCSGGETQEYGQSANSYDNYETIVRNSRSRVILSDFRRPKQGSLFPKWDPMGHSMLPHCRIRGSGCLIPAPADSHIQPGMNVDIWRSLTQ